MPAKKSVSKKANKKSSKNEDAAPTPSVMQRIFEKHLSVDSLTLNQQKSIVSLLGLSNFRLYDSVLIDLVIELLRFCKQIKLTPSQTQCTYHALQHVLYKTANYSDYDTAQFHAEFIAKLTSSTKSNVTPITITDEQQTKITDFLQNRMISKFALYRTALYDNNPSRIQYATFRQEFEEGDIVRFQVEDSLFRIQELCTNPDRVVLEEYNKEQLQQETKPETYLVSPDQLGYICFVSKCQPVPDQRGNTMSGEMRTFLQEASEQDQEETPGNSVDSKDCAEEPNNENLNHCNDQQVSQSIERSTEADIVAKSNVTEITDEQQTKITDFLQNRMISKFALYRTALHENNPSRIQYAKFRQEFEEGDIVRFQVEDSLFRIQEFCLNPDRVVLEEYNQERQETKLQAETYLVSPDQLRYICFVSKSKAVPDQRGKTMSGEMRTCLQEASEQDKEKTPGNSVDSKDCAEEPNNEFENQNNSNDQQVSQSIERSTEANDIQDARHHVEQKEKAKTLIDVIVEQKVGQKIQSMQQELNEYKAKVAKLQNL
eukprot:CAMPEP_0197073796 /NCGR_PEP_ID=MMETSP1384-20130603/210788_1 /TAXON_ID=29189 /ORGANISM="Ammonia sp." /LENGTH=543 /DNA_ID=CAMNT_0042512637 /DNA_START=29 /DNA_END=1661 /DNA_ORIENTATION=-